MAASTSSAVCISPDIMGVSLGSHPYTNRQAIIVRYASWEDRELEWRRCEEAGVVDMVATCQDSCSIYFCTYNNSDTFQDLIKKVVQFVTRAASDEKAVHEDAMAVAVECTKSAFIAERKVIRIFFSSLEQWRDFEQKPRGIPPDGYLWECPARYEPSKRISVDFAALSQEVSYGQMLEVLRRVIKPSCSGEKRRPGAL